MADSRTVEGYRKNIEGSFAAIPRMLSLFKQYDVRATWATVGMAMCRDLNQWMEMQPEILPTYDRAECSSYTLLEEVREYPHLFFNRGAVETILATPGQELATHTYSHFYCGESGASPAQFAADLACAQRIGAELGVKYRSIVFPRNQTQPEYLPEVAKAGIQVYRGNPDHWLYRDGHVTPGGIAGRAIRFADTWCPLTGQHVGKPVCHDGLINVPASLFLRPWSPKLQGLESLRLSRVKKAMEAAAKSDGIFHLWWHPHNFGLDHNRNLHALELILQHYQRVREQYGMHSVTMGDFAMNEAT